MALRSLSLNLKVDTSGWAAGLKKGVGLVDKFYSGVSAKVASAASPFVGMAGGMASIARGAASVAGGMAAVELASAGIGAAWDATAGSVMGGLERISTLTTAAAQIGTTTEALSGLHHAAKMTGAEAEDLDAALRTMAIALGESVTESTPAKEALDRLGLSAKDLAGMSPDQAFRAIVGGFDGVKNAADRAATANAIFGEDGLKMMKLLSGGAGELDRFAAEAKKLGIAVSQVDASKVAAAQAAIGRAGSAVEGLGNSLAVELAPMIEVAAAQMTAFLGDTVQQAGGAEGAVTGIAAAMGSVADFVWGAQKNAQTLILYLIKASSAAEGMLSFLPGYGADSQRDADWAKTFEEDMARAFDSKPSEKLAGYIEDIKSKSRDAARAASEAASGSGAGSAVQDVGSAVAELTDKLRLQAETFGMTSDEIEIYKLAMKGATEAQLADARAQAEAVKLEGANAKAREKLKEDAKGYWESTRTVAEKYKIELGKIEEARKAGMIDEDTAKRATAKAAKDAGVDEAKFASADAVGSESAYSTIVAALSGRGDGMGEVAKSSGKTATNTGKSVDYLGKILARLTGAKEQPLINI